MNRAFLCRAAAAVLCMPAILLSPAPSAAQTRGFTFGPRFGIIAANITETPPEWDDAKDYRTGFTAGVFLDYRITETIGIQPEILYTRKGVKTTLYGSNLLTLDMDVAFDYIELPIVIKYSLRPGEQLRPWLYAGPSFAYCLGSETRFSASLLSVSVDFSSLSHTTDFGMLIGGGFSYPLGHGAVTFDARFQRMFTNALISGDFEIKGHSKQTISKDDFKHYGFVFMAGYAF